MKKIRCTQRSRWYPWVPFFVLPRKSRNFPMLDMKGYPGVPAKTELLSKGKPSLMSQKGTPTIFYHFILSYTLG